MKRLPPSSSLPLVSLSLHALFVTSVIGFYLTFALGLENTRTDPFSRFIQEYDFIWMAFMIGAYALSFVIIVADILSLKRLKLKYPVRLLVLTSLACFIFVALFPLLGLILRHY